MTQKSKTGAGSPTNASDAVDDIHLRPKPSVDEVVDAGVKQTFPASDPPAVRKAETAFDHERKGTKAPEPASPERKSPDWMLRKP